MRLRKGGGGFPVRASKSFFLFTFFLLPRRSTTKRIGSMKPIPLVRRKRVLSDKHRTMIEANDTLELVATPDDDVPKFPVNDLPKLINDLPKELLVSIFVAVNNLRWVRHTVSCVCKEWSELYRSRDASPLHETLEIDLEKEAWSAPEEEVEKWGRRRGLFAALSSTARECCRGSRGARTRCASCASRGDSTELS